MHLASRGGNRLVLALAGVYALAACGPPAPRFKSTDVTGASFGRELALTDHAGIPRTLSDFRGKVVVVFFGFLHCPDVCPTTLAGLKAVMDQLSKQSDRVQVLFVTLDPERDTQEALARYVTAFDARFLGLRGDGEATVRVAKEFKVFYEKRAGTAPGSYSIDHTAASYVFDTRGRLRLYVRDEDLGILAEDLRTLLNSS